MEQINTDEFKIEDKIFLHWRPFLQIQDNMGAIIHK